MYLEKLLDGFNWVVFVNGFIVLVVKIFIEDLEGLFVDDS